MLQLYNNPSQEWAEFLHSEGRKWTDFQEVREEIVRETEREVGHNKVMTIINKTQQNCSEELDDLFDNVDNVGRVSPTSR